MTKEIEKLLKEISKMNKDKVEYNTQVAIIEIRLTRLLKELDKKVEQDKTRFNKLR